VSATHGSGGERDELDRRIDAALRRRFEPPATLDTLAERALPRAVRSPLRRAAPWLALAAAAGGGRRAAVGAFGAARAAFWTRDGSATRVRGRVPLRIASAMLDRTAFPASCRPVGPLLPPGTASDEVHSPDLERLYSAMDACQRSAASTPCRDDEIVERLRATYGSNVDLRPDAAGFLQGPFASADLPTATIVTGFAGEHTSVVVAEQDTTLECCVCLILPEDSGLNLFRWQVGNVVLTEITPLEEPRLLEYFE
jgi:hypothetical protein